MPETIIPPLPAVPSSADAPTRKWMGAVKEMLEVWAARRGVGYVTRADQYTLATGVTREG